MRRVRWLAPLLVIWLMFGVAGVAVARERLVVALQLEPPTLDPTSGAAAATDDVTYHTVYEGLTRLDAAGLAHPFLALGWTMAPDMKDWVFRLRPGVRFHEGAMFDAASAAFSLRRGGAAGSSNAQREALANITAVDIINPLTIRIHLRAPDAGLPRLLALPDSAMLSPHSVAGLAGMPVGTGPFRFGDWRRGDRIRLLRNREYWGAAPTLGELDFRFIADPAAAYTAIGTHAVDLIPAYPAPENLEQLRADPTLRVTTGPSQAEVILALNERRAPFGDLRIRRAIAFAIDRQALIAGAMYGHARAIGSHFPPQDPDYIDLTGLTPHDPARARALLAAAGYPDGFALTLALPPPSYARRTGEIVAAQLRAIGIRVTTVPVEWAQWLDQVFARHDFDATIVAHVEPFDYEIYGRSDYYFGYDGRAVAALIRRLRATTDPRERHDLMGAIQQRIASDAVNGFLFQFPRLSVADARLRDVWIDTPLQMADYATARFAGGGPADAEQGHGHARSFGIAASIAVLLAIGALGWRLGPRRVAGRMVVLALTLLGASLLIFVLLGLVPGDPAQYMLGLEARPETVAALRSELGLGGGPIERYLRWIGGLLRGDAGTSYAYRVPVTSLIAPRLAVSLPLAILAMMFAISIGVGGALLTALKPGSRHDRAAGAVAAVGAALPNFWLALLLLALGARLFGHGGGFPGWEAGVGAGVGALVQPALALGIPQAAILFRVTAAALREERRRGYVRTARAKGLGEGRIVLLHILPNAMPAILTVIGLQLPFLVAGGLIVENVFYLPGLGRLAIQAVEARDLITVQAVVLLLVALTVISSFLVDLGQAAFDPRSAR